MNAIGVFGAACLLMLPMVPATAQVDTPRIVETVVTLRDGRSLPYRVEMGRIPIRDGGSDVVRGHMFFVAYRVVASDQPRPVTFLWNGGPGANSAGLALSSIGPRLIDKDGGTTGFPDTLLAATDIVFVDAIGTGFSRPATPGDAKLFYQTRGDIHAFTEFVRAWRLLYAAQTSPIYLGGESWGAWRSAAVALGLEKRSIPVSGVIIISGRTGLPNSELDNRLRALRTVQQAVAASHYGKLAPDMPKSIPALEARVRGWVLSEYAPALDRIDGLSPAQREDMARQLARHIGLPAEKIDRKTLIVPPRQFLQELLRDRGRTLSHTDMWEYEAPRDPKRAAAVERYLRTELGYVTDRAYIGSDRMHGFTPTGGPVPSVESQWDYANGFYLDETMSRAQIEEYNRQRWTVRGEVPGGQDTPVGAEAMNLNPRMRMFIINGRRDSHASCASTEEILRRQDAGLRERIIFRCYDGGHAPFSNPSARVEIARDLGAFVTGGLAE